MKQIIVVFYCLVFYTAGSFAQYPQVNIPGSEVRTITSSIVSGQEYELQILLPGGHARSNKKYPVVYLMDSQWDFPLLKSLYGQHYYDGFIPEMIIVGVTWGGKNPNPDSLRARDYTPTNETRIPQSGGADKFLDFMKSELFPFIENNYKADPGNRTLMGCSLGGLITLYAMFTHTEMFNGYAAASPAIGWDREVLFNYEKVFAERKAGKPVRCYMTIGDVERSRPGFEKFAALVASRKYPSVNIRSKVLENTGHSGTKTETFGRGLQYIFEKPKLNLDDSLLNSYTGIYQAGNGNNVEVRKQDNMLIVYFSATNNFPMYAATEKRFYSTAEFMNIFFDIESQMQATMTLERYGSSQIFKKIANK
ncbi:MAG: alpha/beta hydrolase-fold protein [Bacteroidota bacterium]